LSRSTNRFWLYLDPLCGLQQISPAYKPSENEQPARDPIIGDKKIGVVLTAGSSISLLARKTDEK
jgi:hypothetical protein